MSIFEKKFNNRNLNKNIGYFELYIGCMFASKSTELIKQANRFKSIGANVLKINHTINNRYDTNNISTHDKMILSNCVSINTLMSLFNNKNCNKYYNIDSYDVIIIEEIQFFKDAVKFVKEYVDNRGKIIIAAGLDGDFNRDIFPVIANLIPLTDKLIKLTAYCGICCDRTPAIFSKLIEINKDTENNNSNIIIGSSDKYIAVCREHYNE
jgi:thymidine kinase